MILMSSVTFRRLSLISNGFHLRYFTALPSITLYFSSIQLKKCHDVRYFNSIVHCDASHSWNDKNGMHPTVPTAGRRGGKTKWGICSLPNRGGICFTPLAAALGGNGASSVAAQGTKTISRRLCIALQGPILGAGLSLYGVHYHIMDQ
jgi:hypothetical protein